MEEKDTLKLYEAAIDAVVEQGCYGFICNQCVYKFEDVSCVAGHVAKKMGFLEEVAFCTESVVGLKAFASRLNDDDELWLLHLLQRVHDIAASMDAPLKKYKAASNDIIERSYERRLLVYGSYSNEQIEQMLS